jgi:outer membrane immunogenic protein
MQSIWDKYKAWIVLAVSLLSLFAILAMSSKARADGPTKTASILPDIPGVTMKGGWTGFHLDGSAGWGATRSEFETQWDGDKAINADNLLLTVGFGWDAQVGNMVLGIMADVTASDINDPEWQWFVGARAGVLVAPKTLVYGLVGYTETIDGQLAFKAIATTQFKDIAGLTYGGGVEHLFAQGWSMKAEYRYVQFGDETAPAGVKDGLKDGTDVESGAHQVRLGISKRF